VNPLTWSADTWAAVESGATAFAFLVAACVLYLQLRDRRRVTAEGITVWVDDRYHRAPDDSLRRNVSVHLKNVGAHPAFDVQVTLGHGYFSEDSTSIGPLAVPAQPVVAPGAELEWPVNDSLRGVEVRGRLVAEVAFRDSSNRWWIRDFSGRLRRWRGRMRRTIKVVRDEEDLKTFGPVSFENPVSVAALFWTVSGDAPSEDRTATLKALCTPESLPAWGDFGDVADLLEGHGLASFPSYPAPGVAYVKFPENVDTAVVVTGPTVVAAKIMTLQYREDLDPPGWRVFGIGASVPPEKLPPPGTEP